jgi:predicted transposase YdaD
MSQTEESDDRELVMRLAPLYQQDREQARQEGREEGQVEGIKQGEERLIIRQINHRFGEIDSSVLERIRGLSTEQLETLGEAFLDFSSLTDLETWLDQNL